jgi:hypothetical protein
VPVRVFVGFIFLSLVVGLVQLATFSWLGQETDFANVASVIIAVVVVGFAYYGVCPSDRETQCH